MYRRSLLTAALLIGFMPPLVAAAPPELDVELVAVGDPDNAPDQVGEISFGAVGYSYEIGIYEVTNAQYAAFLNAVAAKADPQGLYHPKMAESEVGGILRNGAEGNYRYDVKPGFESKPVNYVSLSDAARFANWLTTGDPESGSYDLSAGGRRMTFTRVSPAEGISVQYFVPSENEWYKAAYYDPSREGGAGGYWTFATRSEQAPSRLAPYGESNRANYGKYENKPLSVGTYTNSPSYYGTFDQEGNVAELTDTLVGERGGARVRRGSHYLNYLTGRTHRGQDPVQVESSVIGFRIVAHRTAP